MEGVRLFVSRAAAANPRFELNRENAAAVAEICRRLDGLPLALEIAAARTRLLPPRAMLKRLDQSLKLLTRGARDLPTRQQTLRGAIDWSYDLLDPADQALFARLGVFVGGFTLEAAEAVCGQDAEVDVMLGVETLLENSLLRQTGDVDEEPRFEMLQTIREYALEKLVESRTHADLQRSHGMYFFGQSQELFEALYSDRSTESLSVLESDHDNYRAALTWCLEDPERLDFGVQILMMIFWFWYRHGHFQEGREWTTRFLGALDGKSRSLQRATALGVSGLMAMWEGELNQARKVSEEGLAIARVLEEPIGLSIGLLNLGVVYLNQGRDHEARRLLEECVAICEEYEFHLVCCNGDGAPGERCPRVWAISRRRRPGWKRRSPWSEKWAIRGRSLLRLIIRGRWRGFWAIMRKRAVIMRKPLNNT